MADDGAKALSKPLIAKHSTTWRCASMAEETVEDVQQDVAVFLDFRPRQDRANAKRRCPSVGDGWPNSQLAESSW